MKLAILYQQSGRLDRVSRNATVLCTAGVRRIKKALSFTLNALYVFVQHI